MNGNLKVLERIVDNKDDKGKNKFGKMTHVYNYIKNKSKYFDVSGDYLIIKTDKENNYFLYSIESFTKVLSYLFKQISNKYNPEEESTMKYRSFIEMKIKLVKSQRNFTIYLNDMKIH